MIPVAEGWNLSYLCDCRLYKGLEWCIASGHFMENRGDGFIVERAGLRNQNVQLEGLKRAFVYDSDSMSPQEVDHTSA